MSATMPSTPDRKIPSPAGPACFFCHTLLFPFYLSLYLSLSFTLSQKLFKQSSGACLKFNDSRGAKVANCFSTPPILHFYIGCGAKKYKLNWWVPKSKEQREGFQILPSASVYYDDNLYCQAEQCPYCDLNFYRMRKVCLKELGACSRNLTTYLVKLYIYTYYIFIFLKEKKK